MSNKTPAAKSAKTESAPKSRKNRKRNSLLLIGILILCIGACLNFVIQKNSDFATMQFGSQEISLEYAVTAADREKGLSGRTQLPPDRGLLFQFEEPGLHCFWMKDMNFPIDIVWLDSSKKIIDIRENVSPDSYPAKFCPAQNAAYGLEVRAGLIKNAGVDLGEQLQFALMLK